MSELVALTSDREIGIITINNPPLNILSAGVPEGIAHALEGAQRNDAIKALVLIGSGRTFIAGANIKEFEDLRVGRWGPTSGFYPLAARLENSPKPIVAAIHGSALGGGLEIAMACHYRVTAPSAQLGQPEVHLGLIPGAGGTQRLPRLAGVARALEMCTRGNSIGAPEALQAGIVDRLIEGDLLQGALEFAREMVAAGLPPRKTCDISGRLGDAAENAPVFEAAREEARQRNRGRIAPLKAVDAVEAATTLPFEQGIAREAELFEDCLASDQSKALIYVFLGQREVSKIPGLSKEAPVAEVREAAVVGAGTMGGGIAMVYANAGIPVLLKEISREALDRGLEAIRKNYAGSVRRGRFNQEFVDQRMKLIRPTLSYDGFETADIVVEAVFEEMTLKKQVFAELDKVCRPDAVMASNTSTLDIDELAARSSHPERVVGHHFFAPPNVMRLLEIVRGRAAADGVIATSLALAKKLGKVGVLVGNCFGFVGNRMYLPYQREAQFLLEEGAKVQDVDGALYNFGMAMGPLATADLSGLDVTWRIRKERRRHHPSGSRQPLVEDRLCEMNRFGQKTGAGWYRYEPGNRKPIPDPLVERVIQECIEDVGMPQRSISAGEIVERTIYALINEGARILEEGIALRAVDIDTIYINGYGFPAHRGGPMWFADTVGLRRIYERICEFERQHGPRWAPAPLLVRLALADGTFGGSM